MTEDPNDLMGRLERSLTPMPVYPEPPPARLVRPWFAWDVREGRFFATEAEARDNPPTPGQHVEHRHGGQIALLRQYRFEDDGSFCGIAEPVRADG